MAILDIKRPPLYQQIAAKALHLHELDLSLVTIARKLEVTDKTVAKGLRWLRDLKLFEL